MRVRMSFMAWSSVALLMLMPLAFSGTVEGNEPDEVWAGEEMLAARDLRG